MSGSVVIDLNQWMPGWGENRLAVRSGDGDLMIEVAYDGKASIEETKTLFFKVVSFYSIGSFPGVASLAHKYEASFFNTGCIILAESSELSTEWKEYWSNSGLERICNHYVAYWGSENKVFHIVAEGVEIT